MIRTLLTAFALALCAPLHAQIPVKIYGQELVDQTVARNPGLLVVTLRVTPPRTTDNVIVASNIGRIGTPAGENDLRVIKTGKSAVEVSRGGDRVEVELPLLDLDGNTIGALGLAWPYRAGEDKGPIERKAEKIRDSLARRILNAGNLMDPYPLERAATTKTHAQKLVDETVAANPEVILLALRAAQKADGEVVTLGSTFGRHGKKADAEDLKVIASGESKTHILPGGKRFSGTIALRDASGKTIGIFNVGYAVKPGDDEKSLLARGEKLRDELRERIASAEKLAELDP